MSYAKDHPNFWKTDEGLNDFYNAAAQFVIDNVKGAREALGDAANDVNIFGNDEE